MGAAKPTAAAALLALAALFAPLAHGETTQKDGVRVTVAGSLSPKRLPREGSAPVAVSVAGEISPLGEGSLPQLEAMQIAINSAGRLDFKGIPHCRIGHINPSNNREAIEACGDSLIGEGSFHANVLLPEQSPFPSAGKLLAFNGTIGRRPAIFAHIYGTLLEAAFPRATGDWGYITGISLRLNKRLVRAGCPAPRGFSKVSFPLARTSFDFAGGLSLDATLNRSCEAKG